MSTNIVKNYVTAENIKTKNRVDYLMKSIFIGATLLSASFIIFIVAFIFIKGIAPFVQDYVYTATTSGEILFDGKVKIIDFLFGLQWAPPTILGIGFIIVNTVYVALLSLLVALPISVLTALYIARIAPKRIASVLRTTVELLSSVPSIIYGVFGSGVIVYITKNLGYIFGINTVGGLGVLSTVILLSMMILPTITTVAEVSIRSVGKEVINGSLALGATKTQTNFKVVLSSAKSGIFTGAILGVGRALGEATAVSMVAGNLGVGPTFSFFDRTRTLTSTMLQGV
ncbi:MAG: ABC transporter permease subunit, partial [Firmicutes bacterium]|nr:ABC transporter permease subunit [Bacillota bacterium]